MTTCLPLKVSMVLCLALLGSVSFAEEPTAVLEDDFNRADSHTLSNQWSSKGTVVLKDNAVLFKVKEEEFRPRIKHTFPIQREGKLTVSFVMDWMRESEGTWAFHMQLGNSAKIPNKLVYLDDLSKGIGVHLVWGGGELVDHQTTGSLGYSKGGKFKPLVVVNDRKNPGSIVDKPVITLVVDVTKNTFNVHFNGRTFANLPFDNDGPIDTIRFITNGCSTTGFSKTSIDDVLIRKAL